MAKTCALCDQPASSRGLCKPHYDKLRNRGELQGHDTVLGKKPLTDRLLAKIHKTDTGCWEWTGHIGLHGYGLIWRDRKYCRAHRIAYELFKDSITDDDCICHTCDNRRCINPDHLFKGTRLDNNRDSKAKGRNAYGERNGRSYLSREAVEFIRSSTQSQPELARLFNVSQSCISRVCSGKRWA